jgi:hypothetical protein
MTAGKLEEALHDPVLKAVEGHHGQKTARLQRAFGGVEALGQFLEFGVHRDADRLEAAGGGMALARLRARQALRHDLGQLRRGGDRIHRRAATMAWAIRREARSSP